MVKDFYLLIDLLLIAIDNANNSINNTLNHNYYILIIKTIIPTKAIEFINLYRFANDENAELYKKYNFFNSEYIIQIEKLKQDVISLDTTRPNDILSNL